MASGWNLWVWLVSVVVRRYIIDILIIIITFPYFTCACAARVTAVVLYVCLCVCPHTLFWQYARLRVQ